MKNYIHSRGTRILPQIHVALAALFCSLVITAQGASTTVFDEGIAFQTFITDTDPNDSTVQIPVNGSKTVYFRIWNDQTATAAANLLWEENQTVTVSGGHLSVVVGSVGASRTKPTDSSAKFSSILANAPDLYLDFEVREPDSSDSVASIAPRLRLLPSTYAHVAGAVAPRAITSSMLALDAVTAATLGTGSVGTESLADAGVTTVKIADDGVTGDKIADGAITTAKLADGAVGAGKISVDGNLALNQHELQLNASTQNKLQYAPGITGVVLDAEVQGQLRTGTGNPAFIWTATGVEAAGNLRVNGTSQLVGETVIDSDFKVKQQAVIGGGESTRFNVSGEKSVLKLVNDSNTDTIFQNSTGTSKELFYPMLEMATHSALEWVLGIDNDSGGELMFILNERARRVFLAAGTAASRSDRRFKKNVAPVDSHLLDKLGQISPVRFDYNEAEDSDPDQIGFVAQDVQTVFPELVHQTEGGLYLNYEGFGPLAIGGINELRKRTEAVDSKQSAKIQELETENEQLKSTLSDLLKRLQDLESKVR